MAAAAAAVGVDDPVAEQADVVARKTLRDPSVWTEGAARAFVECDSPETQTLVLCALDLSVLPAALFAVRRVTELRLSGNRGLQLIAGVERMRSLHRLDLSDCGIHELPRELGQLSLLEVLKVSRNVAIHSLPDSIGDCSRLRDLFVGGCGLTELPASLGRCTRLRRLCCWNNYRLSTISADVLQLPRMEVLQVGRGCDLDAASLIAIAGVLKRSTTLRDVGVLDTDTDLDAPGVPEIMAAFERAARSSTTLTIWCGPRSETMAAAVVRNLAGEPAPDPYHPLVKAARRTS